MILLFIPSDSDISDRIWQNIDIDDSPFPEFRYYFKRLIESSEKYWYGFNINNILLL